MASVARPDHADDPDSRQGRMPSFIVAGAAKAGTTSLYAYLKQHPEIFLSEVKETNFFLHLVAASDFPEVLFPVKTMSAYRALFRDATHPAVGEVSPLYMQNPRVAPLIRETIPEVRIVLVLRNPVDRTISAYEMARRNGVERGGYEVMLDLSRPYARNSLYARQVQTYFDVFPPEQIHVFLLDDLESDPRGIFRRLLSFLGVDADFQPDLETRHNVGGIPRFSRLHAILSQGHIRGAVSPLLSRRMKDTVRRAWHSGLFSKRGDGPTPEVRRDLAAIFTSDIAVLESLLKRCLDCWR